MTDGNNAPTSPKPSPSSALEATEIKAKEGSAYVTATEETQSPSRVVATRIVSSLVTEASVTNSKRQAEVIKLENPLRVATQRTDIQAEKIASSVASGTESHPTRVEATVKSDNIVEMVRPAKRNFLSKAKKMVTSLFRKSSQISVVTKNPLPMAKNRSKSNSRSI